MSRRRVVVTGLGAVSALGLSFEESWKAMLEGRNGIGPIERFDTSEFTTKIAGSVMGYVADEHFPPMVAKKLDFFTQFALLAADDCVADAGIDFAATDLERCGVILGTGIGGIMAIEQQHLD